MIGEDNHEENRDAALGSDFYQARRLDDLVPNQESRRPLEVTHEAHGRLVQWGLSRDQITQLEQITSSYEYAGLVGRSESVASRGGVVMTDEEGEWVVLPDFFDYAGDRRDGQCNEIAAKQLAELHESGWLAGTNADLEARGRTRLRPWHCMGTSLTHFNWPGLRHSWTALGPEGHDPTMGGLILDASFRGIYTFEESGYTATDKILDPPSFIAPTATRCKVVGVEHGTSFRMEATVLGVSQDGFYSVGLSFVRPSSDTRIVTVLGATAPNGVSVGCHLSQEGNVLWHDGRAPMAVGHQEELEQILRSIATIRLHHDEAEARRLLAERQRLDVPL